MKARKAPVGLVVAKIRESAEKSVATGHRLQAFDDLLLALVPTDAFDCARSALRLKSQFTPYQQAVADAVQWCDRRQRESDDGLDRIIELAAARFFDPVHKKTLDEFADSIHRAWVLRSWQEVNEILRIRLLRLL